MKPSLEQMQEWRSQAIEYAHGITNHYPSWKDAVDLKFAELVASWGAEQAQQAPVEEPELPEPVIAREEYAVGTGEFYTAAQMHDHYQAGVRAGMGQSQDARRYQWLRDSGFAYANVDLGTDLDGDNFVRYQIRFDIPEPAHSKFEDDEWSASDIDAAIDSAMQKGQK